MRHRLASAAVLSALLIPGPARAEGAAVTARIGNHPGFGRIVFELPAGVKASVVQDGVHAKVNFSGTTAITVGPTPHNVQGISQADGIADIVLVAGARLRQSRIGTRLVLDFVDPARAIAPKPPPAKAAANQPIKLLHTLPLDGLARARDDAVAAQAPIIAPASPPPTPSPQPPVAPMALIAHAAPAPSQPQVASPSPNHAVTLPFSPKVGAAAFRRGDAAYVVFDERRPVDLMALREDPVFAAAAVTVLPEATVFRLPLTSQDRLLLASGPDGWTVSVVPVDSDPAALQPIASVLLDGKLALNAGQPGHVVSVPDPLTGGVIAVGTQLRAGQGVPIARQAAEFTLLPSWQGLAVVPRADALAMRVFADGFVLALDSGRDLALTATSPDSAADTAAQNFSRRFDFPSMPIDALVRREQSAIATAGATPTQDRGPKRLEAAQAMLALGLGSEAQAVLTLAGIDDARMVASPDRVGLSAIAAMLADRPSESGGIEDPRLDGSDEVALWRAVRRALAHEGDPAAAATFATVARLALAYPAPLRQRIMPLIAETMALGGEAAAATVLTKTNLRDDSLDFARALLSAQVPDQAGRALATLDRLANTSDRLLRTRAAIRAIELRLATKAITPAQAAEAMDPQIYAWRGDGRELATRLRVAALRADAGEWRKSLALLRETTQFWPDDGAAIRPRLVDTFTRALANDSANPLPPLDLIALTEENADLIPLGDAGREVVLRLCDRLASLDLPQRAIPLLTKLIEPTAIGDVRSELGAQLAAMQAQAGNPAGALAALANTLEVGTMPSDLLERRTLTYAAASAATGQLATGLAALDALGTLPAVKLQADLAEAAKDLPASLAATARLVALTVPQAGPLADDHARTLLRYAAAAAQTDHADILTALRTRFLPRLAAGPLAEMLRALTVAPVDSVADLPRAAQETRKFSSLTTPAPTTAKP